MPIFMIPPTKGQVQIGVAVIGAIAVMVGSYFSASTGKDVRINDIENKVQIVDAKAQVITERETNHYASIQQSNAEIKDQLKSMNEKLDRVLLVTKTSQ